MSRYRIWERRLEKVAEVWNVSRSSTTTLVIYEQSQLSGHASVCPQEKQLLIENLSKGFDLYDLPRSSPSYTFAIPTTKRCIKAGVFAEDSSIVVCGSDHGRIYIFSTASPIPLQIIRQGGSSTAIQALDVRFS